MDTFTSTNLKKYFSYPFEDKNWQGKLAIAGGLMLACFIIPVLPLLALYGYMMRIIKQVVEGDGQPTLPEWDDWGDLMMSGLKLMGEMFIFALPLLVLWIAGYGAMFFPAMLSGLAAESGDMGSESLWLVVTLLSAGGGYIMFGLVVFLSLLLGFTQSVVMCHVAVTGQFSAAFRFGEWWRILRSNFGEFLLAYVFILGLSVGVSVVYQILMMTIVLCCILPIVLSAASIYLMLFTMPLLGQVYRAALEKME
ncbi:MAG: DUF4013 domain-containing protein [Anaerolineaceae bacterium]|nr:DUF4013 domain-containing protein [Anaerolineaceae bacterium]